MRTHRKDIGSGFRGQRSLLDGTARDLPRAKRGMLLQIVHSEAKMSLKSKILKIWGGGNAMVIIGYVHATDRYGKSLFSVEQG